jgi:hypothetical protein
MKLSLKVILQNNTTFVKPTSYTIQFPVMKFKTILLFIFLLLSKNIFSQSVLNELKAFEQKRYQALINADIATITKLISADLLYTHSNLNFEDKAAYLLALTSGKYKFETFETDSTQYVFLNKKTVVAAGLVHMQGRYNDTPYKLDGRFTAVYIKMKHQWQLAAWQTTKKVN